MSAGSSTPTSVDGDGAQALAIALPADGLVFTPPPGAPVAAGTGGPPGGSLGAAALPAMPGLPVRQDYAGGYAQDSQDSATSGDGGGLFVEDAPTRPRPRAGSPNASIATTVLWVPDAAAENSSASLGDGGEAQHVVHSDVPGTGFAIGIPMAATASNHSADSGAGTATPDGAG